RAAGTAGRGGVRSLPWSDLRRQSRGHLARQRGGTVSAERRLSQIPAAASQHPPRSVRGEDRPGPSRSVEISHRRPRQRGDLHERWTWRVGSAAQDLDPRPFVGELALPAELLANPSWPGVLACAILLYVIPDGFDLGAGDDRAVLRRRLPEPG